MSKSTSRNKDQSEKAAQNAIQLTSQIINEKDKAKLQKTIDISMSKLSA